MKFGILKEINEPMDRRVVFSPALLEQLQNHFPQAQFEVESSSTRIFTDEEYTAKGIAVVADATNCDVLMGINPIPVADLVPNKSYFFLGTTTNHLNDNEKRVIKVKVYDYSAMIETNSFQNTIGLVGAYNAFRAFGIKFELFKLPSVTTFLDQSSLITYLKRPVLPPLKITVIGTGAIVSGVKVIMKAMKIKEVLEAEFLVKNYAQAVFTVIENVDSNDLEPFTKVSDIIIADSQMKGKSVILSQELLNAKDCKLRVVADLHPEASNTLACTLRQSTQEEPFYGYLPNENREVDVFHPAAIVVTAVPNLEVEFPQESSEAFGKQVLEQIIPVFFNGDAQGILQKAQVY